MKLLFCISYYSPYISGLSLYVQRIAEAFSSTNSVSVLAWNHTKKLETTEKIGNVQVIRAMPSVSISKGFLGWGYVNKSWDLVVKNDVVILNLPQPESLITAIFARLQNKRLIVVYHCEIDMKNKFIQYLMELAHWIILALAHTIVTYTSDYAFNSRLLKQYSKKVQTIYPPVPQQKDYPKLQSDIKRQIGSADFVIGVAARLAVEKGFEYLFDSIPVISASLHNKTFKIAIAGTLDPVGEGYYKKYIFNLADKYKKYLVFLGAIEPVKMNAFYANIDLLALPSINSTEAFGMVQVEAMIKGVPAVVTDMPGVRVPITETGMGEVVPTRNHVLLGQAIARVLLNPKKYIKSKQDILNIFSYKQTISFYERLFT